MSGGAWEYVMGVMTDQNGNPLSGQNVTYNSGFVGNYGEGGFLSKGDNWPDEKYYDKYQYGTNYSEYTRRILGDAIGEMGPFKRITYQTPFARHIGSWYSNHAIFVYPTYPWFDRGVSYEIGSEAGMFAFNYGHGSVSVGVSFRFILTPTE